MDRIEVRFFEKSKDEQIEIRQLDAYIARHILNKPFTRVEGTDDWLACGYDTGSCGSCHFAGNMSDAWDVVRLLSNMGYEVAVSMNSCTILLDDNVISSIFLGSKKVDDTPLVICLTAKELTKSDVWAGHNG